MDTTERVVWTKQGSEASLTQGKALKNLRFFPAVGLVSVVSGSSLLRSIVVSKDCVCALAVMWEFVMGSLTFLIATLNAIDQKLEDVRRYRCWSHQKRCHRLSFLEAKQRKMVDALEDIHQKLQQEELVVDVLVPHVMIEVPVDVLVSHTIQEEIVDVLSPHVAEEILEEMGIPQERISEPIEVQTVDVPLIAKEIL